MRDTNQICFTIGLLRDTLSPSTKEFHGLGYEAHMLSSAKDERIKFNSANQLQERAQEYGRRLKSSAHQLAMKYETKKSEGLLDVPKSSSSEEAEGSADLAETDAVLITEITSRAQVR